MTPRPTPVTPEQAREALERWDWMSANSGVPRLADMQAFIPYILSRYGSAALPGAREVDPIARERELIDAKREGFVACYRRYILPFGISEERLMEAAAECAAEAYPLSPEAPASVLDERDLDILRSDVSMTDHDIRKIERAVLAKLAQQEEAK